MRPAEAELIESKRKALRPIPSVRRTAPRAGISEGRWRQVVNGSQRVGGVSVPVRAPAETVVRMMRALGEISPDERRLLIAARPDVANLLDHHDRVKAAPELHRDAEVAEALTLLRAMVALGGQAIKLLEGTDVGRNVAAELLRAMDIRAEMHRAVGQQLALGDEGERRHA